MPSQQTHPSRPSARVRRLAVTAALLVLAGCYEDPQAQMDQAQELTDMIDVVNELNSRTSDLSFTLDSLRQVVVKQDSTIRRLANLAGVPYKR